METDAQGQGLPQGRGLGGMRPGGQVVRLTGRV